MGKTTKVTQAKASEGMSWLASMRAETIDGGYQHKILVTLIAIILETDFLSLDSFSGVGFNLVDFSLCCIWQQKAVRSKQELPKLKKWPPKKVDPWKCGTLKKVVPQKWPSDMKASWLIGYPRHLALFVVLFQHKTADWKPISTQVKKMARKTNQKMVSWTFRVLIFVRLIQKVRSPCRKNVFVWKGAVRFWMLVC